MIVVDDSSSDQTLEIVRAFAEKDPRIRLFKLPQNSGTGVARNFATEQATGRYIAFLDADDLWLAPKLQIQLDFMQEQRQPFCFSFYDCMDESGKPLGKRIKAPQKLTYRELFCCNFVGNLTGIYDTQHFGKIAISSIRKRQDWMLWLTILKQLKIGLAVPQSLALYRIRKNSISASKWDLLRHNFAVYRNFHRFSWPVSLVCMGVFLATQFLVKPRYLQKLK